MSDWANSAIVAAAVSAVVALVITLVQMRQGRDAQRIVSQQDISAKYDRMVDYRLQHPEVLSLASRWDSDCFGAIYNQVSDEDRAWAHYYGYIELCIAYCNAVLHGVSRGLVDPELYEFEHEPLIRLLPVEHYPILRAIAKSDGYVTKYLVNHIAALRSRPGGWDWESEHRKYMAPESGLTSASS